jgi:hypothetical protein
MAQDFGLISATNFAGVKNRREVLKLGVELGAVTLAVGTGINIARPTRTAGGPGYMSSNQLMHHGHEGMGTPVTGVQPDLTNLWRVQVGGMDIDAGINFQGFFPSEIAINAGDSIWFDGGQMPGFHTVTFLGAQTLPDLLIPDPDAGTPVAGAPPRLS